MSDFINQALLRPLELLGRQVLTVLPNVLAMGIILLGGSSRPGPRFFLERLLRVIGFDHFCDRLGMNAALLRGGVKTDPSRLVGRGIYWTVIVMASIAALGALNLTPINQFAQSLLAYVPHLVTAAVILLAGYFLSNFVSRAVLIAAVNAGLPTCPTHRSLFPLGHTGPRGRHGAGTTRHCPAHRRRGIRHYLGRDRAGRSYCIRARRLRSCQRALGAATDQSIQTRRG